MKRFVYYPPVEIPESALDDCKKLVKFMKFYLDVEISLSDAYLFWQDVSGSVDAGWLYVEPYTTINTEETRNFFMRELNKYGYFVEE